MGVNYLNEAKHIYSLRLQFSNNNSSFTHTLHVLSDVCLLYDELEIS